ncbi:MAG: hypothetical protein J6U90_05010 [Methanobrevibacter sp.]|nr:hypothetical protein [Methanobrevibacter sp.]
MNDCIKKAIKSAFKKDAAIHCIICGKIIPSFNAESICYVHTLREDDLFAHIKCFYKERRSKNG